jgi:hypothetical protein
MITVNKIQMIITSINIINNVIHIFNFKTISLPYYCNGFQAKNVPLVLQIRLYDSKSVFTSKVVDTAYVLKPKASLYSTLYSTNSLLPPYDQIIWQLAEFRIWKCPWDNFCAKISVKRIRPYSKIGVRKTVPDTNKNYIILH